MPAAICTWQSAEMTLLPWHISERDANHLPCDWAEIPHLKLGTSILRRYEVSPKHKQGTSKMRYHHQRSKSTTSIISRGLITSIATKSQDGNGRARARFGSSRQSELETHGGRPGFDPPPIHFTWRSATEFRFAVACFQKRARPGFSNRLHYSVCIDDNVWRRMSTCAHSCSLHLIISLLCERSNTASVDKLKP